MGSNLYDTREECLAYLANYFPLFFSRTIFILMFLSKKYNLFSLFENEIDILEIGTGPGSFPFGMMEFFSNYLKVSEKISLNFKLVERKSNFCDIYNNLEEKLIKFYEKVTINSELISKDFNFLDLEGELDLMDKQFDFIILSNVLEENGLNSSNILEIIEGFSSKLKRDGLIIIVAIPRQISDLYTLLFKSDKIKPIAPCYGSIGTKLTCDDICRFNQHVTFNNPDFEEIVERDEKSSSFSFLVFSRFDLELQEQVSYETTVNPLAGSFVPHRRYNIVGIINQVQKNQLFYEEDSRNPAIYICDGTGRAKIFDIFSDTPDHSSSVITFPDDSGKLVLFKNVEYWTSYPKRGKGYYEKVFAFDGESEIQYL